MRLSYRPKRGSLVDRYFSFITRRSPFDALVFHIAVALVIGGLLFLLISINKQYLTTIPTNGGTLVEGIIGTPRFVNPVLAITRADQDMVELVFSGLMKLGEDGELKNDLAESIDLSEDGLTYTIKLRNNINFHNGEPLTAKDVVYTIALIQDPDLKSPLRGNWDNVVVEEIDDETLTITLKEAYTPFLENLTVGILPKKLWGELPIEQIPFSQNNTEPIGSGPYRVVGALYTPYGLINAYQLTAFDGNGEQEPNISNLVFNFYQNETGLLAALKDRQISGTPSLSSEALASLDKKDYKIIQQPLPRTFGIYFNQNKNTAMRDLVARRAMSVAIDRNQLVQDILYGYGIPTTSPIPPGFLEVELDATSSSTNKELTNIEEAKQILEDGGWTRNDDGYWYKKIGEEDAKLTINLSTANSDIFSQTAENIAESWKELGVDVTVSQFEQTDLIQGIIRPRDFEAVLYGADIGRGIDLYPFWHSSQKNDPGLNIAQYTNIEADSLLVTVRTETDKTKKEDAIKSFARIIKSEYPAIFLYTPTFGYVVDNDVHISSLKKMSKPSERFANVQNWHVKSNSVWPVFSNMTIFNN
ncbi:peptide ABC transporter substrate-binding protein [Candidatus Kaiserbacteria bacterium]|nr:peptide ABC transporter substrate-binding protein [Candidatus Kaiserbacteria bacterium]